MKSLKNIRSVSALVTLSLTLFSCHKLEEYNPSGATADAIYTTPAGFLTLVNACYSDQRAWYGKEDGQFMGEMGTDLWFNKNKSNYQNELVRYEGLTPANANSSKAEWKALWHGINLCNAGINRIADAGFTSATERAQREAEIRFLRAWYYWHVVETWGNVALITTETNSVQLTQTRSTVQAIYNLIISDLQNAVSNLPTTTTDRGRATTKAAMGLLARVYLSRAYYSTGSEAADFFTKARDMANQVITRQGEFGVSLYANYADVFNANNNKNNKEALYVISNSTNTALDYDANANRLHMWFLTNYSTKPGLQVSAAYDYDKTLYFMPTRALLDFYDETKDARFNASFQAVWIANTASNYTWTATDAKTYNKLPSVVGKVIRTGTDTAMVISKGKIANKAAKTYICYDRDSTYNAANGTIRDGNEYPALKKFMDQLTRASLTAQPGFLDIIAIRLAEMYLISAEAELQLGNTAAAATQINVLRTRAAIKTPVDQTAAMKVSAADITLDFILDERARELCGEHLRWFDLKRTHKIVDRIKKYNPDVNVANLTDRIYLRPIPQTELDALTNGSEFGQNPGY
jgi:hypothetical protein